MNFKVLMLFPLIFLIEEASQTESEIVRKEEYLKYTKECGKHCQRTLKPRIIGGSTSESGKWPWAALVHCWTSLISNGNTCVGTLIGPRHILTAAHCLYKSVEENLDFDVTDLEVTLGDTKMEEDEAKSSPQIYNVATKKIHPGFKHQKISDDIAILILENEVQINEFITPICLPPKEMAPLSSNDSVTLIGWGMTDENPAEISYWKNFFHPSKGPSSDLKELNLTLDPIERYCDNDKLLLCVSAMDKKHQGCHGDSGGPVMFHEPSSQKWIQMGTFVRSNCEGTGYAIDVTKYLDWIHSEMFSYNEDDLRKYNWWTNAYKSVRQWFIASIYFIGFFIGVFCISCIICSGYYLSYYNTKKNIWHAKSHKPAPNSKSSIYKSRRISNLNKI